MRQDAQAIEGFEMPAAKVPTVPWLPLSSAGLSDPEKGLPRSTFDGGDKFGRGDGDGVARPAHDPAFNFNEAGDLHVQSKAAAGQGMQFLRWMPALFADVIGDSGIEVDDHVVHAVAGMHAKAVAKRFLDGELLGADEGFPSKSDGLDSAGCKGANVLAEVIVGEEEP